MNEPFRKLQQLILFKHITSALLKNGKEWVHFTIQLEHNIHMTHRIMVSDPLKDGKKLLDYRKHVTYQKAPTYLSVRTLNSPGYWRLHKCECLEKYEYFL